MTDTTTQRLIESSHPPPGGKVARNVFHLLIGQAATTVLAVLLNASLGRFLGAADFGLFFLVTSMGVFAYVIVDWGQAQYVIREVARRRDQGGRLLGSLLMLRALGGLCISALTAVAAWLLGYDGRTVGFAALMVLAMLPFALAQGFGIVFRGRERMELYSIVSVLNKALTLGATLLLLLLGAGLLGAIVSQALGGLVAVVAAALLLRRVDVPPLGASFQEAWRLIQGGTPILMVGLAAAAHGYLDAIVLSKLAPAKSVGWFGAARNIFGALIAPAGILAAASYPGFSRAAHDPKLLTREVQVSTRPLVALAVLGGIGTYLFADAAIALIYGESAGEHSFAPAGTILKIFAPGMFLLFMDLLLCTAVLAVERPKPLAVAKWVSIAVTTVLAFLLVPYCEEHWSNGGIGIAISFVASEVIMFVTALRILPAGTLSRATMTDIGRAILAGVGTLALFRLTPAPPLFVGIPMCVVCYALFALALRLVRVQEIVLLISRFRRLRRSEAAP